MTTILNPYITFEGNAREAITFYHSVLGGELVVSTFGESGMDHDPAAANNVMHAQLTAGGLTLMVSDSPPGMDFILGNNISVSLSGDDEAELRGYFDGLSAGGTPGVPLEKAPWGDTFGMFTDKFGVGWLVNIAAAQA
ncbi:MAG: putative glyoxalase family protein [Aeromicrobium sp.]|nr:putative glyoxalase family protein [Aeromicrobium sp.]